MRRLQDSIRREIVTICRAMEGSVTWSEAWDMVPSDRKAVAQILEEINEQVRRGRGMTPR